MPRLQLPPNASPLELALAKALALPDDLLSAPQRISERRANPSDTDLPFWIWEWDLVGVAAVIKDPRQALSQGRKWQKLRGTIAAGHTARNWIGITATHEQEQRKRYHLHLSVLPGLLELDGIIKLSRLSHSMRNTLHRITYKYDDRAARYGRSCFGRSIYSNSSGIRFREDWPRFSMRETVTLKNEARSTAHFGLSVSIGLRIKRHSDIVYGRTKLPAKQSRSRSPYSVFASVNLHTRSDKTKIDMSVRVRPVAGVIYGRTRLCSLQAKANPMKTIRGKSIRYGQSRSSDFKPSRRIPIMRIPMPGRVDLSAQLQTSMKISPAFSLALTVTGQTTAKILYPNIYMTLKATSGDAPWSRLPPGDEAFGASPRIAIEVKETT